MLNLDSRVARDAESSSQGPCFSLRVSLFVKQLSTVRYTFLLAALSRVAQRQIFCENYLGRE